MTALSDGGRAPLSERGRRTRERLVTAARTVFEERVLVEAFPEYNAYRARTARFIPGLI